MRPLIADGGQVTFLRDLAAYSWGKWAVEWPETVPEDQRPKPTKDDRDFGYVAKLGKNPGRMGRRFTRSDVSITAAEYTAEGKPIQHSGFSDVEDVLDAAQKRVGSDVFIERDITRAGLNGNVPYVDFDVDDVVPVLIWGKTLNLPVTSIQEVTQEGAVIDWQIHVGGELISNDLARERANQDIERAIAQERRERQDAVSTVDSKASSAVSTADSANAKSDQALKAATDADGTIQSKLDEQMRLVNQFDDLVAQNKVSADSMAAASAAYAKSVSDAKATQAALESAAADAKRASDNVSNLINAPDGEFRKGVAKFAEFQTMVNDKQSVWNLGIQKTLDAQSDVNTKQQQINAVQQKINTTQSNINRQQGEINTALFKATTAATNAAADAVKASQSATTAVNAQEATVNDTNDLARLTHFRRTRVFIYERASDSQSETGVKLPWDDRTTALTFDVDSSGAVFKWDGAWEGYIKVTAMSAKSRLGIDVFDVLGFMTGKYELWDKVSSEWIERYVIEIFPLWPDKATKDRFMQRGLTGLK